MTRLFLVILVAANAHAGDRQLEALFVNMTPDAASSEASKQCVRALEKKIAADYTHVTRLGETALRKLAKKTSGEPFMSWPAAALKPAKERGDTWSDVVILVDCRPEVGRLEVLVQPASGGLALLRAQKPLLDADLVGEAILRRAWAGFSP
jgi:hypothetical protein